MYEGTSETLRDDGDLVLARRRNERTPLLTLSVTARHPARRVVRRLQHEYSLRGELDPEWAVRPIDFLEEEEGPALTFEDPGGQLASGLVGQTLDIGEFLRVAVGAAVSVGRAHERGLVHRDIKPANILTDVATGRAWLTGFGLASRLPRERRPADPPLVIEGTLAYMSPEQTGRMNRSVDARSDLYSLGVTLYEMLTGALPFTASDPLEWVHCHIAREPSPPGERSPHVPKPVSAIVMKLLAKAAEDRYQTAAGVARDLQRCLDEWLPHQHIAPFALGEHETPSRLLVPEKLYGRTSQVDTLLASFNRVVATGRPELTLVSGYSGIGKSSVVNELHKVLVLPRGRFAAGKFDQYKRDIPYATLAQAFQSLVRPLLAANEDELHRWRQALGDGLGPNARLIVDLVPELKLIVGDSPPVPDLPATEAQRRFQLVLRRFIGVFAQAEHPLALFLDDLQWLDAATLDLLEDLLTQPDVRHLMLIGAYRDHEVQATHPLARRLDNLRRCSAIVHELRLGPLTGDDVEQLVADSFRCERQAVAPLAQLVYAKTAGNPFFAIQFTNNLVDEGVVSFSGEQARWQWDLRRIVEKAYTDNVVELMLVKVNRLPSATQSALQALACLGNTADPATLSVVLGLPEPQVQLDLWEAVRQEFLAVSEGTYRFVHDRVQEAAYSLLPPNARAEAHLRIGRLLIAHTPPEKRVEVVFDLVSQVNRGAHLISSPVERELVAELNLCAGRRAKAATAYESALKYLIAGAGTLAEARGSNRPDLAFELELQRAECEFLTGELASAEERLNALWTRADTATQRSAVACLRVDLYTTLNRSDRAVAVCLEYLAHLGMQWSPHPTEEEGRREYAKVRAKLGSRTIEELVDLPLMEDPTALATLDVFTKVFPPAVFTDSKLLSLAACRAVNLSLERGNSDGSCVAYLFLAMIAGPHFGDYKYGFRFGRLAYELVEKRGLGRFKGRTYLWFAQFVVPWTKHVRECRDLMRRAFEAANSSGDLTIAGYSCNNLTTNYLTAGDPLEEVQLEVEKGLQFAEHARFPFVTDIITAQQQLVRTLRGLTARFGSLNDEQFDEQRFEEHLASEPSLALPECWYWVRKLQARLFAGDHQGAQAAASKARALLWTSPSIFETAEYEFYAALAVAGSLQALREPEDAELFQALREHHRLLTVWAENCPDNFATREALVAAEIARIEGRALDAERLYEQAIRAASANGFVHNEALANELAARFYASRGFQKIADAYLRDARYGYLQWGAVAKVRQLERLHPSLRGGNGPVPTTAIIGASVDELDLATVVRTMQALTSEIVLERWTAKALTIALEDAGARRAVLLVLGNGDLRSLAEATLTRSRVEVRMLEGPAVLPEMVLRYVERTHEPVVLDDASLPNDFSKDPYIAGRRSRSILCLPLAKQDALRGILYLENDLASCAFTPRRTALLKLLASQAALSLENVWLHSDLQRENDSRRRTEAALRRSEMFLAEAQRLSRTGSFGWIPSTGEIQWSEETHRITGMERWAPLALEKIIDRMHPEDAPHVQETLLRASHTGEALDYEHRFVMPNGAIRFVRIIAQAVHEPGKPIEYVGAITDITDRREAEAELQNAQADLARVMRVSALGELAASIAHEISQPLAAISADATAGLNWLGFQPPNIHGVSEALAAIDADCQRAGNVLSRINALLKRAPLQRTTCDLNAIVVGIVPLVRLQFEAKGVALDSELDRGLPAIRGDSVQLQQVLINLLLNAADACRALEMERRRVVVRTATEQRGGHTWSVASVADTGKGIEPEVLAHIFDAFYTTKSDGLGMGLSISRSIVLRHDGELVVSPNMPHGTTFTVRLPSLP
jgi:PAS domain S-box-containing protein